MNYIKEIAYELLIVVLILLLFLIVFFIYRLPLEAYLLASSLVLFLSIISWTVRSFSYRKELNKQQQLDEQAQLIKEMRNQQLDYQHEIEAYFMTWVHQMKTPITAAKLLLEQPDEHAVSRVRQEVLQMENYTNLTLSYLKLMNPGTDMDFAEVKLDDLLKPLFKKYAIQFIHYETKLHYEPIEAVVLTDARWASIMIEQLLNNALKYARGKAIWVQYHEGQLSIKDNGIGIAESDLPKIFDRGFSGYNGRLNDKSSGLGLYITDKIAKRLNHPVTAASVAGQGTTMTISFPQHTYLTTL